MQARSYFQARRTSTMTNDNPRSRHGALLLTQLLFLTIIAASAMPSPARAAESVPTRVLALRDSGSLLVADGVIEASRQAIVASQLAGRVLAWQADAGDAVRAGQLLARIDAREAREAVAAARARLTQADAALARLRDLEARRFVSGAALDQAIAERDSALAALRAAEATAGHAELRAPFAGIVAIRHVEVGDMALPGHPLFTIFQPGALRAVAQVPLEQASLLRGAAGQARAVVDVGGSPDPVIATRITVLPTADAATHVLTVRLDLPPTAGARPGAPARVRFTAGRAERLTLPPTAILHRGGIAGVYVRAADEVFRLRQVRIGDPTADGEVEILAGLVAGETVALDPVKAGIARRQSTVR
jgi:RND family efflux transporter MFP subunit